MIPILGTFLTLFVGGHPVHFWVINSYNWQLFGNYHFSDQFVLKITPYKRDLGVKVDIFDPQLELKIHFWVINNWESNICCSNCNCFRSCRTAVQVDFRLYGRTQYRYIRVLDYR